jgi:16S rRNA (cytosine1402-N4)-methyltransferase
MQHVTVLQQEAVDGLSLSTSDVVVDATFGSGGHAREIISRLDSHGTYVGIDADETALKVQSFIDAKATIHLVNDNFRNISHILSSLQVKDVDAILADLGWRMEQFTEGKKGFSFQSEEPLLMTFGDPALHDFTARDIVNDWAEESIADIIFGYGEERNARKIAKAIVTARKMAPIETTTQLIECIESAFPKMHYRKVNVATKTFQALRIAVNDELSALQTFLSDGYTALKPGGRMAIITFHSLEDRIVKHYFRTLVDDDLAERTTKKPIVPTDAELALNPRARSAKLRIITKTLHP